MFWVDHVCDRLFDEDSLQGLLAHLARDEAEAPQRLLQGRPATQGAPPGLDPISTTVVTMATRPLHLCLNEVGAAPFLDRPTLVLPYARMTRAQKQFIRDCVDRPEEWTVCNGVVVFRRTRAPVHLPALAVLVALCRGVMEAPSPHPATTRVAVCNILLQRVQSHVQITADTQRSLNAWLAEHTAAREGVYKPPPPPPPPPHHDVLGLPRSGPHREALPTPGAHLQANLPDRQRGEGDQAAVRGDL